MVRQNVTPISTVSWRTRERSSHFRTGQKAAHHHWGDQRWQAPFSPLNTLIKVFEIHYITCSLPNWPNWIHGVVIDILSKKLWHRFKQKLSILITLVNLRRP